MLRCTSTSCIILTLPVQIPHPSQARFKFPIPPRMDDGQMPVGCPGDVKVVELIGAYPEFQAFQS